MRIAVSIIRLSIVFGASFSILLAQASAQISARISPPQSYSEVPNQYVKANGVRFAYRTVGKPDRVPLVLLMHTRGTMDSWDPKLVDLLAEKRLVIAFDNKGVGLTEGKAPQSFEEMADDAVKFIGALGFKKVDLLGFSIGGAIGQEVLLRNPELVRRAIFAGTSMKGGDGVNGMSERSKSIGRKETITEDDFLYSFFATTPTSLKFGHEFLDRLKTRKADHDKPVAMDTVKAQAVARETWGRPEAGYENLVKKISIPVLIANGKEDIRMPTINSYKLFLAIPSAQLDLYPDSGHGFLFQYPEIVAAHFNLFLSQDDNYGANNQ